MTRTDRLKLAKAARELASEYAEGRGPELESWHWCGCASAELVRRSGIDNTGGNAAEALAVYLGDLPGSGSDMVSEATRLECGSWQVDVIPGALVFPLLWAADELESAP